MIYSENQIQNKSQIEILKTIDKAKSPSTKLQILNPFQPKHIGFITRK